MYVHTYNSLLNYYYYFKKSIKQPICIYKQIVRICFLFLFCVPSLCSPAFSASTAADRNSPTSDWTIRNVARMWLCAPPHSQYLSVLLALGACFWSGSVRRQYGLRCLLVCILCLSFVA